MSEVAREIRRLRKEKDWTQTELAVYAGSSQPTINQIESGARNPSTRTLEKIAGALGVEVRDLFPKAEAAQEPRLFEPSEGLKSSHNIADQWITVLTSNAAYWHKQLDREDLGLKEAWELSSLSFELALLYLQDQDVVSEWCTEHKAEELTRAELEITNFFARVEEVVEQKVKGREGSLGDAQVTHLEEWRKRREERKGLLGASRQRKANA